MPDVAVRGADVHLDGQLADHGGRGGLQEAGRALLQGRDGLAHGRDVGLHVALLLGVGGGLLVAQGGGRRDGSRGLIAVGLVLNQVRLELLLLGLGLRD
eukprot:11584965-Heterocapsa_arctica.AAC.2